MVDLTSKHKVLDQTTNNSVIVNPLSDNSALLYVTSQIVSIYGDGKCGVMGQGINYGVRGVLKGRNRDGGISERAGVYGHAVDVGDTAIRGDAENHAYAGVFTDGDVIVDGGNLIEIGGLNMLAVKDPVDNAYRVLYCPANPECWIEDFGSSKLLNVPKKITLDAEFVKFADTTTAYHVFLTPRGDSKGLYVYDLNVNSFMVGEQQGGTNQVEFSYRVVAKRKDVPSPRWPKLETVWPR